MAWWYNLISITPGKSEASCSNWVILDSLAQFEYQAETPQTSLFPRCSPPFAFSLSGRNYQYQAILSRFLIELGGSTADGWQLSDFQFLLSWELAYYSFIIIVHTLSRSFRLKWRAYHQQISFNECMNVVRPPKSAPWLILTEDSVFALSYH